MFEFFIWLMVSDRSRHHWEPMPFVEQDEDRLDMELDAEPERLRDKIRHACADAGLNFDVLTLRDTYAGIAVSAGFGRNHALPSGTERRFLTRLASLAPTTYGVIYTLDTDKKDASGEFNVLKLANQEVRETTEILVPKVT
jgi:hypothetical protein